MTHRAASKSVVAVLAALLLVGCAATRGAAPLRRPQPQPPPERAAEPRPAAPPENLPAPEKAPPDMLAGISPSTEPHAESSLRRAHEGRRRFEKGDLAGALDVLEQAIRIDPSNPHGYFWLAQVHYRRGRSDQAIAFAEKAAVLFGRSDQAWLSQTYSFQGTVFEGLGRYADARRAYRRALDAEPGNMTARTGLARLGNAPE